MGREFDPKDEGLGQGLANWKGWEERFKRLRSQKRERPKGLHFDISLLANSTHLAGDLTRGTNFYTDTSLERKQRKFQGKVWEENSLHWEKLFALLFEKHPGWAKMGPHRSWPPRERLLFNPRGTGFFREFIPAQNAPI